MTERERDLARKRDLFERARKNLGDGPKLMGQYLAQHPEEAAKVRALLGPDMLRTLRDLHQTRMRFEPFTHDDGRVCRYHPYSASSGAWYVEDQPGGVHGHPVCSRHHSMRDDDPVESRVDEDPA